LACLVLSALVVAIFALPVVAVAHLSLNSGAGIAMLVGCGLALLTLFLPQALIFMCPVPVWCKSFSLYCLQQLDGDALMLPLSGRLTVEDAVPEPVEPGFSPTQATSVPEVDDGPAPAITE